LAVIGQTANSRPPLEAGALETPALYGRGFYEEQSEAEGRWASRDSVLDFEPTAADRYLALQVLSEFRDLSQVLTVTTAGNTTHHVLPCGWSPLSINVPAGSRDAVLSVNRLLPAEYHPGDPRTLGVRLRSVGLHGDAVRHERALGRYNNLVANGRETLAGQPRLGSTPPNVGIDLYGACNIKPPCVYCSWDSSKALEGDTVDTPFTLDTLREYGPFFDHSTDLVNCSIGEPFMMKNIDELLDTFADGGKYLQLTTNGQILTDTNIRKLIGRPIDLNVSFDAATPDTYAILRNRRFDLLVNNVRRLIAAKGGPGRLPIVTVVFMPMRANVNELDAFVRLCADLRVDHLVLRALNFGEVDLNWDRAGYRFEYNRELLPFDELVRTSGRAAELCRRAGVPLRDQLDFGGEIDQQFAVWFEEGRRSVAAPDGAGAELTNPTTVAETQSPVAVTVAEAATPAPPPGSDRLPACTEPWKSLYILRRGVLPCCHGAQPLAPMEQYREVWNSPTLQAIRRDLARGKFHQYCKDSPSCPIVRKSLELEEGRWNRGLRGYVRRAAAAAGRYRRQVVWARQWAGIRLRRAVTEPGYVRKQIGRGLKRLRGQHDAHKSR
jgi:MoaA/NifB/PqqE/SkfB family radical SAM enzyme